MKPSRNEYYSFGWTDPVAYDYKAKPIRPTHTRTVWIDMTREPNGFVEFNQTSMHNDEIHGVTNETEQD